MNSTSLKNNIYNFILRWLFSTNHKCGVLALFNLKVPVKLYNVTVNVRFVFTFNIK